MNEIHAMARDKRGAHLALSLERLEAVSSGDRVPVTRSREILYFDGLPEQA